MKQTLTLLLAAMLLFYLDLSAQGMDNAGNYGTWNGNGGSGFGTWTFIPASNNANAGRFIGTSTNNDDGDSNMDGDIDTGGDAWGLFANGGGLSEAFRLFTTDMDVDDRFSINMDNGFIDNGATVGLALQRDDGTNLLEIFFVGGNSFYTYNDADGVTNSTIGFTDEGINIRVDITGESGGTYAHTTTITDIAGGTFHSKSGNFSATGQVGRLRLFNANAGSGSMKDQFFNSLSHEVGILPVELSAFKAENQKSQVVLRWETTAEINNSHFVIERASTEMVFHQIGEISGKGNSTTLQRYQFVDRFPLTGNNYYRLRQVDFDGAHEFSEVLHLDRLTTAATKGHFYPNPVQDRLYIRMTQPVEGAMLRLLNSQGQVLLRSSVALVLDDGLPVSHLPKGMYHVQVVDEQGKTVFSESINHQ